MITDTKTRAALYCRVSSQEQAEHGVSLDDQRERLESWAGIKGYQIIHTYIEEGEFGWNTTDRNYGIYF